LSFSFDGAFLILPLAFAVIVSLVRFVHVSEDATPVDWAGRIAVIVLLAVYLVLVWRRSRERRRAVGRATSARSAGTTSG